MQSVQYPDAQVTWELWETGAEDPIVLPVQSWSIDEARAFEPLDWQVTLLPGELPSGLLLRALQGEGFDEAWNLNVWLRCRIEVEGYPTYTSPKLVCLDSDWALDPNEFGIQLSGKCPMESLLAEDQQMAPIRSVQGSTFSAHGVIGEILAAFKITSYVLHFPNFGIPQLNRVGAPIEWIREILRVVAGWCRWEGDTLHVYAGGINVEAATATLALDEHQAMMFNLRYSTSGIRNRATVERTGQAVAGLNQPARGATPPYIVKTSLDNPVMYAACNVDVYGPATVGAWVWFDEDDNVLTPFPSKTYIGPVPAHAVQFTLTPSPGYTDPITWKLTVPGSVWNPDLGPYDEDYSATYTAAGTGLRGVRPYKQPFVLTCCPNQGTAQLAAQIIVWEGLRMLTTASVASALYPDFQAGAVVAMTCPHYGFVSKKFLIEKLSRSGDVDSLSMSLDLVRTAI